MHFPQSCNERNMYPKHLVSGDDPWQWILPSLCFFFPSLAFFFFFMEPVRSVSLCGSGWSNWLMCCRGTNKAGHCGYPLSLFSHQKDRCFHNAYPPLTKCLVNNSSKHILTWFIYFFKCAHTQGLGRSSMHNVYAYEDCENFSLKYQFYKVLWCLYQDTCLLGTDGKKYL